MKRLTLACALVSMVALCASVPAATLLTDDFDYGAVAGDLDAVSGGNWTVHSGTSGPVDYVATGLSMTDYVYAGVGGAAVISASDAEDVNRTFASQTGDMYCSVLINVSSAAGGGYFLHFKNASTIFRARVFAQDVGGNLRFGFSADSSTATYAATDFAYNTTYLVVMYYNGTTGNASLWVLDTVPTAEPGTPLLTSTGSAGAQEAVALRQTGGIPEATIDGLRVGDTWADTVPVELSSLSVE